MDSSAFNRLPVLEIFGWLGLCIVIGLFAVLGWVIVGLIWLWHHVSILVH